MNIIQLKNKARHQSSRGKRASFSSISQDIINNIYQAITGNVPIPHHFVLRALANGLPEAGLQHAIRSAGAIASLPDFLLSASEQ